jgi:pimeloyl-ACP methyl ester carboxylesterase
MITTQDVVLHGHPFVVRTGGAGPVILLLHGMAGSGETWRRVMPLLARDFTVVAPDLLGHGYQPVPLRRPAVAN